VPKQATFAPVKVPDRVLPWKVDVPASLSETGRRERRFFATKTKAETFIDQEKTRIKNYGTSLVDLTPGQREAASAAFRLMGELPPLKLVDIVQEHLDRKRRREASVTVNELKKVFSGEKKHSSKAYVRQIRHVFSRLDGMGRTKVSDVASQDIEKAIRSLPPTHRNLHLRILRAAFNYAVKKGWTTNNPIKSLDFAQEPKRGEVEVLSVRGAARLLIACIRTDASLLPYHLFGIFCGVRPEELERMQWEHVELDEKHILLPAEVTKIGRRRVIEMEPNLIAWVQWYFENHGIQKGSISPPNLRRRLRKIRRKAKLVPWVQDVMRHTYASNWLAMHSDINRLLLNMGHYNTAVLWEHYHKAVLRKDAERFWALKPREPKGKIIKIGLAS